MAVRSSKGLHSFVPAGEWQEVSWQGPSSFLSVEKYQRWKTFFQRQSGDRLELSLGELEALLGADLPGSARQHQAWWSGERNHTVWRQFGWRASPNLDAGRVIFTRGAPGKAAVSDSGAKPVEHPVEKRSLIGERLVLVGCVKTKVARAAQAKDLYDSPLWRKRRRYAEATGQPWAILSAEHGLVEPDEILEPYDRYLGSESAAYRRSWSARTAEQVIEKLSELGLRAVEFHAGSAYVESGLAARLREAGVEVSWPVQGLPFGKQLRWYS